MLRKMMLLGFCLILAMLATSLRPAHSAPTRPKIPDLPSLEVDTSQDTGE